MRPAPAVTVDLAPDAFWRGLHAGLAALAAACAAGLLLRGADLPPVGLGAALAGAALAAAGAAWWHTPWSRGRLRWDGQQWWFEAPDAGGERPGRLHLMIDLGDRMLLRFDPDTPSFVRRPAWLCCGPLPPAEDLRLRAAVYCRRLDSDPPPRHGRTPR